MTIREHLARLVALGLPLVGSQVAQMAIGVTDTVMLARYDVEALAGQVLGSSLFVLLLLLGAGFGWSIMGIVAAAEARGDAAEIRRVTRMALWLSTAFGVLAMPVFLVAGPLFGLLGQAPVPAELAGRYLGIQGWSLFPALWIMVLRSYLAGIGRTRAVFWTTLMALGLNGVLNYALIFGRLGAPEMGVAGAALGSLIGTAAWALALGACAVRAVPDHALLTRIWRPDGAALGRVLRLGLPIGITTVAEAGLFSASSVMMGWLGTVPLAAHGIALQITSITFMVHVGLSQAATIRAGNAAGRGDADGLRLGAGVALGLSAAFVAATVAMLLSVPGPLYALFLGADEPARAEVVALGAGLLAAAALFQLVDAAQVMALGLLRGVQDTAVPMWLAAISYWAVGAPAAWAMGFALGLGGVGIWLGLAAGLGTAAVTMQARFWRGAQNGASSYVTSAR